MDSHARFGKRAQRLRQEIGSDGFIDEKRFACIAHAHALRFRIKQNGDGAIEIGRFVHIGMAIARARLDDGHFRTFDAVANKAGSAARNEHVDNAVKLHEGIGRRAIGGIDEGNAIGGKARGNDRFAQRGNDCRVGMEGLRAAAQHACIARLQANARSIGRDVRARLIHHGDNAQRHAHARKFDAAFDFAALEHAAQRVRQASERFKGIGHGIDAAFI